MPTLVKVQACPHRRARRSTPSLYPPRQHAPPGATAHEETKLQSALDPGRPVAGWLILAVTVIEVALIVSLMLAGGFETGALARDTVFAAVMLILNGIVGLCLLVGGTRHHEQRFGQHGVSALLATLAAISVLTLVLPNFTTSVPGPIHNSSQLAFIAVISFVLYGTFALVQGVVHLVICARPTCSRPSCRRGWRKGLVLPVR